MVQLHTQKQKNFNPKHRNCYNFLKIFFKDILNKIETRGGGGGGGVVWVTLQSKSATKTRGTPRDLLCSQLDEFAQKLRSLGECVREANFGRYPELKFVKTPPKHVQIAHHFSEIDSSEGLVQEFILIVGKISNKYTNR